MNYYLLFIALLTLVICTGCKDQYSPRYEDRVSYFNNISSGQIYSPDSPLTCVTFNIHLGFRADMDPWNKDLRGADTIQVKNIAAVLKKAKADFIALQEVPWNRYNAEIMDFLEALAQEMGMNYAFGGNGFNDPYGIVPVEGQWGNAILSVYPIDTIINTEVEYLDVWERRSLLDAKINISDSLSIHLLSTHHLPSEQGIPNTAQFIRQLEGTAILMGDFNYVGPIEEFRDIGLRDVDSLHMEHWIDRIFYPSSEFSVAEIGVLLDTLRTSDHPANYCILHRK